jgi:hypothetical protein
MVTTELQRGERDGAGEARDKERRECRFFPIFAFFKEFLRNEPRQFFYKSGHFESRQDV